MLVWKSRVNTTLLFFVVMPYVSHLNAVRTFVIFITDKPVGKYSIVVRIRAAGDEDHSADEKAVARHLTGKDRLAVEKMTYAIGPLKIFQQKIEIADEEMLFVRNFTGCENIEVIKHAVVDYRKTINLTKMFSENAELDSNCLKTSMSFLLK